MKAKQLQLPRKDKNGMSYLSPSQISLFLKDKITYYNRYIVGEKFEGNEYTDFGSKVGEALEMNNYEAFDPHEAVTLLKVKRLDEFEKRIKIQFEGFYVTGYIDTNTSDYNTIIDYKTGGKGKHTQYNKEDYKQLCYYALGLRQEFGVTPKVAQVHFIPRLGNLVRGIPFKVGEDVKVIDVDISLDRLTRVYWETIEIAKEIEAFYLKAINRLK